MFYKTLWFEYFITMIEREVKLRYRNTFLGISWLFVTPFLQLITLGVIFNSSSGMSAFTYIVYLFSGITVWNFVSNSISKSTPSIVNDRYLLKKTIFPSETIVLSIVFVNVLQYFLMLILILVLMLVFKIELNFLRLFLILPFTFLLMIFTSSISLLLAAINVKYRDINLLTTFLLSLLFFLTPIFYPVKILSVDVLNLISINPLFQLLSIFRWILLGNYYQFNLYSYIGLFVLVFFSTVGFIVFKYKSKNFEDWL